MNRFSENIERRIVMNGKRIVAFVVLGMGVAVCHPRSELYAGQSVPAQRVAQVQPSPDDPAWVAWRTDFETMLQTDQKYKAANDDAETYEGDDADEYSRLESIRDARYLELARVVYEQHFGRWVGDDAAFDDLIASIVAAPIHECAKVAVQTCGKGNVCSVTVTETSCSFTCRDSSGACPATPVP